MMARGEMPPDAETTTEDEPAAPSGNLLRRFFPPAPPLPGRPDPLAGFDRSGPLAPVRERLFLLRRNLVAWVATGVVALLGFYASFFYAQSGFGIVGTFVMFGALIGAGWFGWQRPTLYGTAAALLSYFLLTAVVLWMFGSSGVPPDTFGSPAEVIGQLSLQAAYQAGLGFLGGWYGGYLRRRQTQLSADVRRRR
jgi:hypothetical protein